MSERWSALDLVEGFHLAHVVATLHEEGILAALNPPQTAAAVAKRLEADPALLEAMLTYAAARTDLVVRRGDRFSVTPRYDGEGRFLLDQYCGAYAPNARALGALLRGVEDGRRLVDRRRHAEAFQEQESPGTDILVGIVLQLGLTRVLDVGCGTGSLLAALARRRADFVGWGVDANPEMCAAARRRLIAAGVANRVTIFEGDGTVGAAGVPPHVRGDVEALSASSLLNELFHPDAAPVVAWLRAMRAHFPGRPLLVSDYYGRLGRGRRPWPRRTILHDFVQCISGQGVPLPNREAWAALYTRAGCALVHVVEDARATYFVHIVRL